MRCSFETGFDGELTPMLTLYGDLDSGNVYKVRQVLAQLGIVYRCVDTTQNRGEPATAEFRAINPIGKIPTIVFDDGRMLSESGAILYFLARDTELFPADAWDQANVLRWMFFEQYSHEPYIAVNRHWRLHLPPAEQFRLADRISQNHARGEHALAVMEQRLGNSSWLAAERYTIADIAIYAYTHTVKDGGFELARCSGIRACLERVRAQPGHIPQIQDEQGVPIVKWTPSSKQAIAGRRQRKGLLRTRTDGYQMQGCTGGRKGVTCIMRRRRPGV
jgi:glutathione S-transferase